MASVRPVAGRSVPETIHAILYKIKNTYLREYEWTHYRHSMIALLARNGDETDENMNIWEHLASCDVTAVQLHNVLGDWIFVDSREYPNVGQIHPILMPISAAELYQFQQTQSALGIFQVNRVALAQPIANRVELLRQLQMEERGQDFHLDDDFTNAFAGMSMSSGSGISDEISEQLGRMGLGPGDLAEELRRMRLA